MKRTHQDREDLACRRLVRVVARHGVANWRTLEQKISDAGPGNQRIDPHVLTVARKGLCDDGTIVRLVNDGTPWFHLSSTDLNIVDARLKEQLEVYQEIRKDGFVKRVGQTLEIAVSRALANQKTLVYFGGFRDLEDHDDSALYPKVEPPELVSGRWLPNGKRLDFLVQHSVAGFAGVEVKNIRAWLYPHEDAIVDLVGKAVAIDSVPVLIARRIPFVTFKLLWTCGVVLHQTYNQLYPEADRELGEKAKHKRLLGYHDIRMGNQPDKRLVKFVCQNLPKVLPEARERFEEYKDLLAAFGGRTMGYAEFAGRVRRRSLGLNEDNDWDDLPDE